ncbi:hypothetical protein EX30DRAFT_372509 [Ascodesmis nigricans]|uniref:Uncharacterized protein n=1 Tax=Ascodesmis nigricans TaxID=341454 RepID=A0A4S2MTZ5_9PEZI|nr:hypothetical protein EX30DRAFT_372509 [Ascodesmis nigricans]
MSPSPDGAQPRPVGHVHFPPDPRGPQNPSPTGITRPVWSGLLGKNCSRLREMMLRSVASQSPPPTAYQYSAAQTATPQTATISHVGSSSAGSDAPDTGSLDMDMVMEMCIELKLVLRPAGRDTAGPVDVPETADPGMLTVVPGLGQTWDASTNGIQSLEAFMELGKSLGGAQMPDASTFPVDQTWEKVYQPGSSSVAPTCNPPPQEALSSFLEPSNNVAQSSSFPFPGYYPTRIQASYDPASGIQLPQQQGYQHLPPVGSTPLPHTGPQQPLSGFQSSPSPSVSPYTGSFLIPPHHSPTNQFPPQHQVATCITPPHSPHLTNPANTYPQQPSLSQQPAAPGHHNRILESLQNVITPSYADIQNHLLSLSVKGAPAMDPTLAAGWSTSGNVMATGMLGPGVYLPVNGNLPYPQPGFFFATTTPQAPASSNTAPRKPQKKRTAPNRVTKPRKTTKQATTDGDDGPIPKWGNHWVHGKLGDN